MAVATFDTLKFANTLKAAGVPEKQAEAQAAAFAEVIQINFKDLASRDDVASVRAEIDRVAKDLSGEIDRVAKAAKDDLSRAVTELRQEIAIMKQELLAKIDTAVAKLSGELTLVKWMLGVLVTGVAAILIRLFLVRPA